MKRFDMKEWGKAAGVRAVKTVAQTAVGVIGASAMIAEVDWQTVLSGAALAGIVSLLTSIAGLPEVGPVDDGTYLEPEDLADDEIEEVDDNE